MASRHHTHFPERKSEQPEGSPTQGTNVRPASAKGSGMGAYNMSGRGAPMNGQKGTEGYRGPVKERTARWPTPGPTRTGHDTAGANIVKTRPARHGIY